jgi:hypothetical protein
MFRAAEYNHVGGYRPQFRYTQDWDLWLRLADVGKVAYVPQTLFALRVGEHSVSSFRRDQQLRLKELANRCLTARRRGEDEAPLLAEAARVSAEAGVSSARCRADNSYFIGKCLFDRRDERALKYLRRAAAYAPWRWRHWAALAGAAVLCRRDRPQTPS